MRKGDLGTLDLNACLQEQLNPADVSRPHVNLSSNQVVRVGDRVIQVGREEEKKKKKNSCLTPLMSQGFEPLRLPLWQFLNPRRGLPDELAHK